MDRQGYQGMVGRRQHLQSEGIAFGTGAVTRGETAADTTTQFTSFVETNGPRFEVNGERVQFNGTNNYRLMDPYTDKSFVDSRMQRYDELGVSLIRTWGFMEDQGGHSLLTGPREYNEAGFDHLDYVIQKAGQHDIRLVLPLTDYWDHYGGMSKYAEWAGLSEKEQFYDDPTAQSMYRDYVEYVLTRENSYTGTEYRNDPTILAWEPANEPRCTYRQNNLQIMQTWFEETAAHIKSIDSNHLISSGMEGFSNHSDDNWRTNGNEGTDYIENHKIHDIDICSIHLYPVAWNMSLSEANQYLSWRAQKAREEIGKPFYAGEFQWEIQPRGDNEDPPQIRNDSLEAWYESLGQEDADAATVWHLRTTDSSSDGFVVWPTDETSMAAINSWPGALTGSFTVDPANPAPGETATFDAGDSVAPNGSISSYEWDLGDGTTATGRTVEQTYDQRGDYTVSLTVTDDGGETATATRSISVGNTGTTTKTLEAENGSIGGTAVSTERDGFEGSGYVTEFTDDGDSVTVSFEATQAATRTLKIRYASEFGEKFGWLDINSAEVAQPRFAQSQSFTTTTVGEFEFEAGTNTVRIRSNYGYYDIDQVIVEGTRANEPPSASFTYSPNAVSTGETLTFDASSSSDSDGSISSYEWEFGDGTTATGQTTSHSYSSSGEYTVTLTVTDDEGVTGTAEHPVTVGVAVSGSDETISVGGETSVDITADNVGQLTIENLWTDWTVDVGDIPADVVDNAVETDGTVTFTWQNTKGTVSPTLSISVPERYLGGTYDVTLTATNTNDSVETTSTLVIE